MYNHVDSIAKKRREAGLTRRTQEMRDQPPHPAWGGTRGYSQPFRQSEIQNFRMGYPITSSRASIYRWEEQILPYQMTGNSDRETIVGMAQTLMCHFLIAYPESHNEEVAAFIFNGCGELYTMSQISKRKLELKNN